MMRIVRCCRSGSASAYVAAVLALCLAASALAQGDAPPPEPARQSLFDFIRAGGVVGYAIILLSVAGLALVVDAWLRIKEEKLVPPNLVERSHELAKAGRFGELLNMCKTHDSMFGRIVGHALSDGSWGIEAVREGIERQGKAEVTRLHQRVGYIGFIATVAPMLGLLGTVTGMIESFNVLGAGQAHRPDELAAGIAEALVTTCMGLIIAVPLMFCFTVLRDRVTRIGQEAAGQCEKMLRMMEVVVAARALNKPAAKPLERVAEPTTPAAMSPRAVM